MKFREYEAKQIFRDAGIPVPNSELIEAAAWGTGKLENPGFSPGSTTNTQLSGRW